ncbi:hypothetical protein HGRIS_003381 [Hohenbuehelia grisea]|uniref:Uncharacterized protein n=1 Tax=Hohenbuehelia grisea TaxID=104357 RepID=A0ABR3JFW4_9AGAR
MRPPTLQPEEILPLVDLLSKLNPSPGPLRSLLHRLQNWDLSDLGEAAAAWPTPMSTLTRRGEPRQAFPSFSGVPVATGAQANASPRFKNRAEPPMPCLADIILQREAIESIDALRHSQRLVELQRGRKRPHEGEFESGEPPAEAVEARQRQRQRTRPPCPRNGLSVWCASSVGHSVFSSDVRAVLGSVTAAAEGLGPLDASNWGFRLASYVLGELDGEKGAGQALGALNSSLETLVTRLNSLEHNKHGSSFTHMVNLISLAVKVEVKRLALSSARPEKRNVPLTAVAEALQQVLAREGLITRTFHDWVSQGKKFAALAAAGSLYILWTIAANQKMSQVASLNFQDVQALCNLLRNPNPETTFGKTVRDTIIPALAKLREQHPLRLQDFFDLEFLEAGEVPHLDFTDIHRTQGVLDRLKKNEFNSLSRNEKAWAPFCQPIDIDLGISDTSTNLCVLTARSLGLRLASADSCLECAESTSCTPCKSCDSFSGSALLSAQTSFLKAICTTKEGSGCDVIQVRYEPRSPLNRTKLATDRHNRFTQTKKERLKASEAPTPHDLNDLERQLCSLYRQDGTRAEDRYIYLPFEALQAKEALAGPLDKQGQLSIFGDLDQRDFSDAQTTDASQFSSLHFDVYNRYSTCGSKAPRDIHPANLTKQGRKRSNPALFIPRPSEEIKRFPKQYESLRQTFGDVFEQLRESEYKLKSIFAENLPGDEASPVFPFSGVVVNLNVQTTLHIDGQDTVMCLVLAIGEFSGGDLCLLEAGLRVEVRNGDWIVFDSKNISHFNMPYVGRRASFVLHSDKAGERWVKEHNGWGAHLA